MIGWYGPRKGTKNILENNETKKFSKLARYLISSRVAYTKLKLGSKTLYRVLFEFVNKKGNIFFI